MQIPMHHTGPDTSNTSTLSTQNYLLAVPILSPQSQKGPPITQNSAPRAQQSHFTQPLQESGSKSSFTSSFKGQQMLATLD